MEKIKSTTCKDWNPNTLRRSATDNLKPLIILRVEKKNVNRWILEKRFLLYRWHYEGDRSFMALSLQKMWLYIFSMSFYF